MALKNVAKFALLLVVVVAAVVGYSHAQDCQDCMPQGGSSICWTYWEGYKNCMNIHITCPGNPFCEPGDRGNYTVCQLSGEYEYCVIGKNGKRSPEFRNVQWRTPGVETFALIPWVADDAAKFEIAKKSSVANLEWVYEYFQKLQLRNGINAPAIITGFSGNIQKIFRLTSEEYYDKAGTLHVRQFVRYFEVTVNRKAKPGDPDWVKPDDVVNGLVGKQVEELKLEDTQWTLTNSKGISTGKIAPYRVPMTKAQVEKRCPRSQKHAQNPHNHTPNA